MKYGLHTDGRKCGPIDPAKIAETGWTWYDTIEARDDAAIAAIPLNEHKANAKSRIDRRAGDIRCAYVSPGAETVEEYRLAEEQAKAYLADTTQTAPSCVVSAADYEGLDYQAAAQSIIDEAAIMTTALENIRAARLSGKKSIDAAVDLTAVESAEAAANVELDSLMP